MIARRPWTLLLCLLALAACGDKEQPDTGAPIDDTAEPADDTGESTDTDTGEAPVEDADGDGFTAEEGDCDDSDPNISPTATDLADDGIDQNCDGIDGVDGDGDGWASDVGGGEDCDDADASVYPGAEETWYDGVDSDCDGASDYDQDGDGHDAEPHGGDCDDTNAVINPDGYDIPDDGIDQDCDGDEPSPYAGGWEIARCDETPIATGNDEGDVALEFELFDQYGEAVSLYDFCEYAVIVEFGAFWDPYSPAEAEVNEARYQAWADRGLMVLTVWGEDEIGQTPTTGDLSDFAAERGLTVPVLADPGFGIFDRYSLGYIPLHVLLSPGMQIETIDTYLEDSEIEAILPY